MKYLLVGNGAIDKRHALERASAEADCVIQFNICRHAARIKGTAAIHYVFVSNTGTPLTRIARFLRARGDSRTPAMRHATIVLARQPAFYRLKQAWLWARRHPSWRDYTVSDATRDLPRQWRVMGLGLPSAWRLERRMRRAGMPGWMMPSTGMIAFDWVEQRLKPGDQMAILGFGWEGWEGHPWRVERKIMKEVKSSFSEEKEAKRL